MTKISKQSRAAPPAVPEEPETTVVTARVQNPEALALPQVEEIVRKSWASDWFSDFETVREALSASFALPQVGAFVAVEEGQFVGFSLVHLPESPFVSVPSVSAFYNEGSKRAATALIEKTVDFIVGNGYTRFIAMNQSKASDEVWARAFAKAGKAGRVGSIMEFTVGK